jgi:hypothetical protein
LKESCHLEPFFSSFLLLAQKKRIKEKGTFAKGVFAAMTAKPGPTA